MRCRVPALPLPMLLALLTLLLPTLAFAALPGVITTADTETVSGRMFTFYTATGERTTVPDLAVKGVILVELWPTATPAMLEDVLARTKCEVLHSYPFPGMFLIGLPDGMSVVAGVNLWRGEQIVKVADADRIAHFTRTPNDPMYGSQYHLPLIGLPQAWDLQTGSSSVVIAIVDSGVDTTHEDLASRIWVNTDEIAGNGLDDDNNGYIDDVRGWDFQGNDNDPNPDTVGSMGGAMHGTHVAGCAAAASNNSVGVAGPDWGARIMPVKIGNGLGLITYDRCLDAIAYAVDNGATVINMSWGGGYSEIFTDPLTTAWAAGVSLVVAAGNDSWRQMGYTYVFTDDPSTWQSPLCNDGPSFLDNHVIGVGASDENDLAADFTNVDGSAREFVDVMAPGVDILATYPYRPTAGFIEMYGEMSGTSMASPVTAGVVGLLRAHFPTFGPDAIAYQLRKGCVNIDALNPADAGLMGSGRISAINAMADLPPGAARSVQAVDTPGDDGGSITVTWNTSVDDGRGANDVTSYAVYRSDNGVDGWTQQGADLPKGAKGYVDSAVLDYTDYFYRVDVKDAVNTVASRVAGPVQARDDVAPPAVTVVATDTQDTTGGSISLNWSTYTPPADFGSYKVYRSLKSFSDITETGVVLVTTITSAATKSYQDRGVENNKDYWYAVTAADASATPNELRTPPVAGPVRANPNFTLSYPAGLSLIAIGVQPLETDLGVLFGRTDDTMDFARYQPSSTSAGAYHRYSDDPADLFLRQALGRGFWLRTARPVVVNASGALSATDVRVDFSAGWNQLGNPFDQTVDISNMRVRVGGTEYSLPASNASGYTADYFWAYDTYAASYRLVSASHSFARTDIRKGEGFFFYAMRAGQLVIPLPSTTAQATPVAAAAPGADNWSLRLVARVAGGADTDNFVGVRPQAETVGKVSSPPRTQGGVDLYFGASGGRYATQYFSQLAAGQTCAIGVAADPGSKVQLAWPDLSQLPASCRPVLRDEVTGRQVYLRTSSGYSFALLAGEAQRKFTLELSPNAGDLLTISSLQAQAHGKSTTIAYALSAPANVTVDILNLAGRLVRSLPAGDQQSGLSTALWDGVSATGTLAPAGTYLVRVRALAADGQAVSAVQALRLR